MAELYNYQRQALQELIKGKRIIIAGVGSGKSAMAMKFVEHEVTKTGKRKVLIVTTASKARTNDFQDDANLFCPSLLTSLSSLSVISWHKLGAWVNQNWGPFSSHPTVYNSFISSFFFWYNSLGESISGLLRILRRDFNLRGKVIDVFQETRAENI